MLILGEKYKFTEFEKQILHKKNITLNTVEYNRKNPEEVLQEIEKLLKKGKIKIILLNTKAKVADDIVRYLTNIQFEKDIELISIETFMEKYLHKCYIPEENTNLHYLSDIKPFTTFQYIQKRVIDYIGVVILLLLTFPILIYARYKIKQQSPGTSMFKQLRVGQNNKEFKCIKFRSMHLNAYHDPYTRKNDTRVFPWGNTMRKTRIDELPQMLNVLKGDMHFIGPRAEWNILKKEYEQQIPYYNERHLVKPGITGWAQVNYPYGRDIEDTKQKLMYDLYYIKYWNILLEMKIVWKTILVVLGRKGV
ncbi:MAG: sugar transferase [Arcobacter sp.]|nr:MAG: sugar transferase [Arcobacter sp.]